MIGMERANCPSHPFLMAVGFTGSIIASLVHAHGVGVMGERHLDWKTDQIIRVMGSGNMVDTNASVVLIDGKRCIRGNRFDFDVRDSYAFDIDEQVELAVEIYSPSAEQKVELSYDAKNRVPVSPLHTASGPFENQLRFPGFDGSAWQERTLMLPKARFANGGLSGSDFSIYLLDGVESPRQITLCGLRLKRTYTTLAPPGYGRIVLDVNDELGRATPVRVGFYAKDGRAPLPSEQAVPLRFYDETVRLMTLRPGTGAWPVQNRAVFYIDGRYEARLPVGEYNLVMAKGPEYRMVRRSFFVKADETTQVQVKLRRWSSMPASGWYSGDAHIHYARAGEHDDIGALAFAEAEDLHVANLLQMGNSANVYFRQYNWAKVWRGHDTFVLAPGQEDPRTLHRGHTLHLNMREPVRNPEHYLQYESVFERTRAQGAVVGYAHALDRIGSSAFSGVGHIRGMLLDVPFGLVDFLEVLQLGAANTRTWFDFLNLGYKLAPVSGTDYPYLDIPGIVRSYVHVDGEFTPQAWFDGLKQGHVFVTDGPMIELEANGKIMGAELHMRSGDKLVVRGKARINPDFGRLKRLLLIEQGEIVKTVSSEEGAEELELDFSSAVKSGTWFVLRAESGPEEPGTAGVALSAPIYVNVEGKGFWKPAAVPRIVANLKRHMDALLEPTDVDLELWETQKPNRSRWTGEKELLKERVAKVNAIYEDLLKRAKHALAADKEHRFSARGGKNTAPTMAE